MSSVRIKHVFPNTCCYYISQENSCHTLYLSHNASVKVVSMLMCALNVCMYLSYNAIRVCTTRDYFSDHSYTRNYVSNTVIQQVAL